MISGSTISGSTISRAHWFSSTIVSYLVTAMTLILFLDRCCYSILPRIYMILNPILRIPESRIPWFPGVSYGRVNKYPWMSSDRSGCWQASVGLPRGSGVPGLGSSLRQQSWTLVHLPSAALYQDRVRRMSVRSLLGTTSGPSRGAGPYHRMWGSGF